MHKYDVECDCEMCVKTTQERKSPKPEDQAVTCPGTPRSETPENWEYTKVEKLRFDQH